MFNNLIESCSHSGEFKRRGSFVLSTSVIYAVLFIVAGVVSIYAVDARLEEPNDVVITMLPPVELSAERPRVTRAEPAAHSSSHPGQIVREVNMSRVDDTRSVPTTTSAAPNAHLPQPLGQFIIGDDDSGLVEPAGAGHRDGGGNGTSEVVGTPQIDVGTPPSAVVPVERTVARVISKGPITGLAISLPKPPYPQIAIQAHAQGAVNVQVLVDETGKVISAKAVSGHPLLQAAAQRAAYSARFSPTRLGDQAVKVSGLITYNFTMQ